MASQWVGSHLPLYLSPAASCSEEAWRRFSKGSWGQGPSGRLSNTALRLGPRGPAKVTKHQAQGVGAATFP